MGFDLNQVIGGKRKVIEEKKRGVQKGRTKKHERIRN